MTKAIQTCTSTNHVARSKLTIWSSDLLRLLSAFWSDDEAGRALSKDIFVKKMTPCCLPHIENQKRDAFPGRENQKCNFSGGQECTSDNSVRRERLACDLTLSSAVASSSKLQSTKTRSPPHFQEQVGWGNWLQLKGRGETFSMLSEPVESLFRTVSIWFNAFPPNPLSIAFEPFSNPLF